MSKLKDILIEQFNSALAWGMVYGPELNAKQWDEMRDRQAAQFANIVVENMKKEINAQSSINSKDQ